MAALNSVDYGADSEEVPVVAATTPFPPSPITIELDRETDKVTLTWSKPEANGATITGYKVKVADKAFDSFKQAECSFVQALDLTCFITITHLKSTRFDLKVGDTIKVEMTTESNYGPSSPSSISKLLAFKPRSPVNLESNADVTTNTKIGL